MLPIILLVVLALASLYALIVEPDWRRKLRVLAALALYFLAPLLFPLLEPLYHWTNKSATSGVALLFIIAQCLAVAFALWCAVQARSNRALKTVELD